MSDTVNKMIQDTNASLEESKKVLQSLANEIASLIDVVQPALDKQIAALRSARMSTVSEIREALTALRDLRKFFLESDYEKEMERLERFTVACRMLKELKSDGTLDAVADVAIRMGLKEQSQSSKG